MGKPAILTIADDSSVTLLQIAPFIHAGHLPPILSSFLSLPSVRKIGRGIKSDLKRLSNEVKPSKAFSGAHDLATMAEERGLVPSKVVSLADLSARILHQRLDKDPSLRLSTVWEDSVLPQQNINYAALDAWASWLIYKKLESIPLPGRLDFNAPAGTEVRSEERRVGKECQ